MCKNIMIEVITMHKALDFLKGTNLEENKKKKIIFLDIDGVIQPYNNTKRFDHNREKTLEYIVEKYHNEIYRTMDIYDVCAAFYDWDEIALAYIKDILCRTKSYIVIHSGWKDFNTLEQLKALFVFYNMDDYIIDSCDNGDKVRVIKEYLEKHQDEIEDYIILDDLDMSKDFGEHFLKTHNVLKKIIIMKL
jgi:DNA-binding transcriptional regulator YhcF (GntR family)